MVLAAATWEPLNFIMKKNVLFFFSSSILLALILSFFTNDYLSLLRYTSLMNKGNRVYACFQHLSLQIKNAAVLNPALMKAGNAARGDSVFFTDRSAILWQLDVLQSTVEDSINKKIAAKLDSIIKPELSWIIESNVLDSIIYNKSPAHIASFVSIDSLLNSGIQRTAFLLAEGKRNLDDSIRNLRIWMVSFIILSGVLLIYTSISLFKQQFKRKEKEKELGIVLNRISDGVVSVDNKWRYTFLNDAALATHPRSKEETLGKIIWDVHPAMKGTVFWDKYHEAMLTKQVVAIEGYYAAMNTWFSVKVYPSADGLTIFYNDVTEAKKAEEALAKTLKEITDYKQALDESSIVAITDENGLIRHVNDNFCTISKYKREVLLGQDHRIINSGSHSKAFISSLWQTIGDGKIWRGELQNHRKDGIAYWVDTTIVPFLNEQGKPYQFIAISSDITARKSVDDLIIANKELAFQYGEKEKRAAELVIANKELAFQSDEKEKRAAELIIANKELAFQNNEKEKRAAELIVANEELVFQSNEKEKRATELLETLDRVSFLASIADNIQDPVVSTSCHNTDDAVITRWNKPAEELLEWKSSEVIGKTARQIFNTSFPYETREEVDALLQKNRFWQGEVIYHTKSGKPVYVLSTMSHLKDNAGNTVGNLVLIRDITKRKKAEDALSKLNEELEQKVMDRTIEIQKKEKKYRYLFQHNPLPMWVIDSVSLKFVDVNEMAVLHYGYSRAAFLSMTVFDIQSEDDNAMPPRNHFVGADAKCYARSIRGHQKKDGTIIQVEIISHPISFEEGDATLVLCNDVTEKKKAEEQVERNERRFRALVENNSEMINVADAFNKITYRTPSASRITGWTNEESIAAEDFRHVHPDDREKASQVIRDTRANPGKPIHSILRSMHKKGNYIWLEGVVTNLLNDVNVNGLVSNYHDITERIKAEEKLIQSEKIYKTIASSIPGSAICLLDADYRYLLIEGDMLGKLGYSKDKLLGNKAADVLSPENFARLEKDFEQVFKGETVTAESSSDGYDIVSRFIPLKDENNIVYAMMTVALDVTSLKNAQRDIIKLNEGLEEKILQRTGELKRSNEELESFSYSVSHDLRAPLRAVHGYARMLKENYETHADAEANRLMDNIIKNGKKMGQLIDDLLNFSRLGRKELKKVKIDMLKMVTGLCREFEKEHTNQSIEFKIGKLPSTDGDKISIQHVWQNLISNAVKYSGNKEKPVIEIGAETKGDEIIYHIRDNGAGFDMRYASKLFGVFQRLHSDEEFEGTGVGLALVQRILLKHGGRIWAESKVDEGAIFYFTLKSQDNEYGNSNPIG